MKPHVLIGLTVTVGIVITVQPPLQASPAVARDQPSLSSANEAETYNDRGVKLAEQGKIKQAIAAFNQAIKIHPKFENAHNNLGLALGSQNKFLEATAAFKRALQINPKNFETYNNLGIALGSQGKFPEAVAAFNQAIQINPSDPTSRQNLGVTFWSQGKLPEAVAFLQKAKELYSVQNNNEGINHVEEILQEIKAH